MERVRQCKVGVYRIVRVSVRRGEGGEYAIHGHIVTFHVNNLL